MTVVPLLLGATGVFLHQSAEPTKEIRAAALAELRARRANSLGVTHAGAVMLSLRAPEASDLEISVFERVDRKLVVYRAANTAPTSPTYYLIAATPGGTIALGGATAPELVRFVARAAIRFPSGEAESFQLAMRLARWIDPYGATRVAFPGQNPATLDEGGIDGLALGPEVLADLQSARDTIITYPDGSRSIRIAAVSVVSGYVATWAPHLYTFQVGPDGALVAWVSAKH